MFCELTLGALMASASLYTTSPCDRHASLPSRPGAVEISSVARDHKPAPPTAPPLLVPGGPVVKITAIERDMAVRTVFGEADDEPVKGQVAVVAVIRNRALMGNIYGGPSVTGVIKKPYAFEPWLWAKTRARMYGLPKASEKYQQIARMVDGVFAGTTPDPTDGATHFYAPVAQRLLGRKAPDWGRGKPKAIIGGHHFFRPRVQLASAQ